MSKRLNTLYLLSVFACVAGIATAAQAQGVAPKGDAQKGKAVFAQCAACHTADANELGPRLGGVVGRDSGSIVGFHYSRAMKNSHLVWDAATLNAYIANPQSVVPGNVMPFSGIADAGQRADLIAYLATLPAAASPVIPSAAPVDAQAPAPTPAASTPAAAPAGGPPPSPADAGTIIDQWAQIPAPPPVTLKPVKVDPKTTALLVLDFLKQSCNDQARPRCVASIPKEAKFLADARSHNMLVVYSAAPGRTLKDIVDPLAPKGDEPSVITAADKFVHTDLEKILKDHGITTIIVTGTTSEGAVLYTASNGAFLGFKVIVPVDGSSAANAYAELASAWTLANAPGVSPLTTLTRFDMIGWQ